MEKPKNKNSYWWLILVVAVIVAVVLFIVLSKKKKMEPKPVTQPTGGGAKDKFGGDVVKIGPSTDIMVTKPKSESASILMTAVN